MFLNNFKINILDKLFHDKALLASGINQFWRFLSGPLNMILIAHFLTEETQGYWYSFISICAMSVFADLGFTAILLQFAAHELKNLKIVNGKFLIKDNEDESAIKKLGSLFNFSSKWVFLTVIVVYPIIYLVGFFLYTSKHTEVGWQIPWLIYIFFSAVYFYCQSLLSFVEGCNQVAKVQIIRFISGAVNSASIAIALIFHCNLFALALSTAFSALVLLILMILKYTNFFRQLTYLTKDYHHNWKESIFKLLWKYAITFSSGYLVFQIYTPLAFSQFGAEYAGKIGLTMSIMMAGFTISNIWLTSRSPQLNALTAAMDWRNLDILFKKRFISGLFVLLTGLGCFLILAFLFNDTIGFFKRILPMVPLTMITSAWVIQYIISGMATYMRLHKEEPIVDISIAVSIVTVGTTLLLVKYCDKNWMFLGFLVVQIIVLPIFYRKFNFYRTVRHTIVD